jgi:hypothetical protein
MPKQRERCLLVQKMSANVFFSKVPIFYANPKNFGKLVNKLSYVNCSYRSLIHKWNFKL